MIIVDAYGSPSSAPAAERVLVALEGELDIAAGAALSVLVEAVRDHPGAHVLVDLEDVTFLDASALHAFARARAVAEEGGGCLSFHGPSTFARGLLELWHLGPIGSSMRTDDAPPGTVVPRPRSAPGPATA